jgi:hypothetical protein
MAAAEAAQLLHLLMQPVREPAVPLVAARPERKLLALRYPEAHHLLLAKAMLVVLAQVIQTLPSATGQPEVVVEQVQQAQRLQVIQSVALVVTVLQVRLPVLIHVMQQVAAVESMQDSQVALVDHVRLLLHR